MMRLLCLFDTDYTVKLRWEDGLIRFKRETEITPERDQAVDAWCKAHIGHNCYSLSDAIGFFRNVGYDGFTAMAHSHRLDSVRPSYERAGLYRETKIYLVHLQSIVEYGKGETETRDDVQFAVQSLDHAIQFVNEYHKMWSTTLDDHSDPIEEQHHDPIDLYPHLLKDVIHKRRWLTYQQDDAYWLNVTIECVHGLGSSRPMTLQVVPSQS